MIEVTFTSYPKNGKKLFKTGVLKQKSLPLKEADARIKEYAKTLSAHEAEELAFTVLVDEGGNEAEEYTFDTQVEASDVQFGIISLISRDGADGDIDDKEREDIEDLQDKIQAALDSDTTSYAEALKPEKNSNFETDEAVSNQQLEDTVLDIGETSEESEDEKSNDLTPEDLDLAIPESENDLSGVIPETSLEDNEGDDLPDPNSELVAQNKERAAPVEKPAELTVTSSGKFENPTDIFEKIPDKYNTESFNLGTIKAQLGYKNNPSDKFDEELNRAIDEALKDTGLSALQSEYDVAKSILENNLIDALTTKYNEITKDTVENIVALRLEEKINQLVQENQQKKLKNEANMQQACSNEEDRLNAQDKAKLDQFKVRLQTEHQESMRSFKVNQQKELDTLNEKADNYLAETKSNLEKREHDKVVNEINQELSNTRVELSNNFNQGLRDQFTKSEDNFRVGLNEAIGSIQEKRDEIQQRREKYELAKAKLAQKQKENELKARELDQKEEELALTKKQIEGLPDAIAAALTKTQQIPPMMPSYQVPGNYYYGHPAGSPQNQTTSSENKNTELEKLKEKYESLTKMLTEKELKDVKKELATTKNSKKHWQIGIISFLAVATLTSSILFFNNKNHISASKPSIVLVKNAEKTPEKPSSSKKQDSSSKKTIETRFQKQESPEEKYNSLKTWSEKVDYLNGLVGQKDVRTLQVINQNDPTSLSKLYLAIAQNNQNEIRDTWSKMNADERKNVSDSARNSVVLAFYAVHDWQNGWLAKNAS